MLCCTGNSRNCPEANIIRSLPGGQHTNPSTTLLRFRSVLCQAARSPRAILVALVAILSLVNTFVYVVVFCVLLFNVSCARHSTNVEEGANNALEVWPCHR